MPARHCGLSRLNCLPCRARRRHSTSISTMNEHVDKSMNQRATLQDPISLLQKCPWADVWSCLGHHTHPPPTCEFPVVTHRHHSQTGRPGGEGSAFRQPLCARSLPRTFHDSHFHIQHHFGNSSSKNSTFLRQLSCSVRGLSVCPARCSERECGLVTSLSAFRSICFSESKSPHQGLTAGTVT